MKIYSGSTGFDEFADRVGLRIDERKERQQSLSESYMPFKVTDHYTQLIASQSEPYRIQLLNVVLPPVGEKPFLGRFDPYGNKSFRLDARPFLQHKYRPTLLLHIDDFCISNCQFCYKVNEIRHEKVRTTTVDEKVSMALGYLAEHPEVNNVLFTGGDPASFRRTKDLISLVGRLISQDGIRVVRFATKGLAYDPERFLDQELLGFLAETNRMPGKQVCIIAQMNHPAEICDASREALCQLSKAGVQVRGQPALVRGVNDSVETLTDLQQRFLDSQIISYYLTVFMPVRGVEQYAIPLDEAFRNVAASRRNLNGLEKKGVLLASHDFGKLEIAGFYPTPEAPEKILLKWHQAAMPQHLPESLKRKVPTRPDDILLLDYLKGEMYCVDHVFERNGLPYIDSDGVLVEQ